MTVVSNPVYQTVVEELETLLSPRVVSRSLKEGLRQLGKSPDTADITAIERILKAQVYRQLQVTMPVTQAKEAVSRIVDRLRSLGAPEQTGDGGYSLAVQEDELARLQEALRPFNLYFEWPEVQKLRAQVQLLEAEHEAGRESYVLAQDAAAQYRLVEQKLEDQLVLQARELGELDEALELVRSLGGPKIRRLETVVNQVRAAQENRQLAPAEIERARRLARELRKLMESSVYAEKRAEADTAATAPGADATGARLLPPGATATPDGAVAAFEQRAETASTDTTGAFGAPPASDQVAASATEPAADALTASTAADADVAAEAAAAADAAAAAADAAGDGVFDVDTEEEDLLSIDTIDLDPEAHERIRMIDIGGELQDLSGLEAEHGQLLAYRPGLAQRVDELRAELVAGRSVAEVLRGLRADFEATTLALRDDLREELTEIAAALGTWREELDTSELAQATKVTLGILSTALPSLEDVNHVRHLHQLAQEQAEGLARAEAAEAEQLRNQEEFLRRLEDTLVRYQSGPTPSEDVALLRQELDALRSAQERRSVVPEVVASARQVEERLARDLAERATEASERRRARLDALRAQLEGLPVTETLSERAGAALREIDRLLDEERSSAVASALLLDEPPAVAVDLAGGDPDVDAVASVVEELRRALAASVRVRLQALGDDAARLASTRLMERVHLAIQDLERDRYPDMAQLRAALEQEREAQRLDQVGELHRLTRAVVAFQGSESPEAERIRELLAEARAQLEAGETSDRLGEATDLLERLEREAAERLESVPRRLDAALVTFAQVARLNSEDVATVRRILMHLDSQRDALERVSLGLRLQLEASLRHAEQLLVQLTEEVEATRVIADQLVAEGLLDDVLGVFGSVPAKGGASAPSRTGTAPAAAATPAASGAAGAGGDAAAWLARYADEEGVTGVALVDADGNVSVGASSVAPRELDALRLAASAVAVAGAGTAPTDEGAGHTRDALRMVTIETEHGVTIVAWLDDATQAVVTLSSPALLQLIVNRLRRDVNQVPSDRS